MSRLYSTLLDKYPLLTKCLTCGTFFALGDLATQKCIERRPYDLKRNINFFVIGSLYFGPLLHYWYSYLLPHLSTRYLGKFSKKKNVLLSMVFDQLLFAPVLYSGYFFFAGVVEQRCALGGMAAGQKMFKAKILQTLAYDLMIWPSATCVNLYYVPIKYQFLFFTGLGFFWDIMLCYIIKKE